MISTNGHLRQRLKNDSSTKAKKKVHIYLGKKTSQFW